MNARTETKQPTLTGRIEISTGYVYVYTSATDCEGAYRSIWFPRTGRVLYGNPSCHWSVKPLVPGAMIAAKKYLKNLKN